MTHAPFDCGTPSGTCGRFFGSTLPSDSCAAVHAKKELKRMCHEEVASDTVFAPLYPFACDSALLSTGASDETVPFQPCDLPGGRTPIQSVLLAGNERSLAVAEALRALGFDVRAIRKPTVPEGTERLRITLHAYNTDGEVRPVLSMARSWRGTSRSSVVRGRPRVLPRNFSESSSGWTGCPTHTPLSVMNLWWVDRWARDILSEATASWFILDTGLIRRSGAGVPTGRGAFVKHV